MESEKCHIPLNMLIMGRAQAAKRGVLLVYGFHIVLWIICGQDNDIKALRFTRQVFFSVGFGFMVCGGI